MNIKIVTVIAAGLIATGCGDRFARQESRVQHGFAKVDISAEMSRADLYFGMHPSTLYAIPAAGQVMLYIVDQNNPGKMIALEAPIAAAAVANFTVVLPYGQYSVAAVAYAAGAFQGGGQPYCGRYMDGSNEVITVDGSTSALTINSLSQANCGSDPFNMRTGTLKVVSCGENSSIADMSEVVATPNAGSITAPVCTLPISGVETDSAYTPAINAPSFRFRYLEKNNLSPNTNTQSLSSNLSACTATGTMNAFTISAGLSYGLPGFFVLAGNFPGGVGQAKYRFPIEFAVYEVHDCGDASANIYSYLFPFGLQAASTNTNNISRVVYKKNGIVPPASANGNPNNDAKFHGFPLPTSSPNPTMVFHLRRGPN